VTAARFPTLLHQQVAELVRDFFATQVRVDTVLLVNSCARGQAVPDSDVDVAVLVKSTTSGEELRELERLWVQFAGAQPLVEQFRRAGRFSQVHLDVFDGKITPSIWDDGGGPDSFEVEIGNRFAHSLPLHKSGPYFRELQAEWLPYYPEGRRLRRLAMVRDACAHDLDYIPFLLDRSLYFQAFDRLYKAHQEFLQALFIARKIYPIAYNKWIREQVAGWLGLPDLYRELPAILSIRNLESDEMIGNADALRNLLNIWVQP
jgi:predicted nucleotidyltransferase